MSIRAGSSVNADSLTPYAVTRRNGPKEDTQQRRKRRDRRSVPPAYKFDTKNKPRAEEKILSPINPREAAADLRKVERDLQVSPDTAQETQATKPDTVRQVLRS